MLEAARTADPGGSDPSVTPAAARAAIDDVKSRVAVANQAAAVAIHSAAASDSAAAALVAQAKQIATSVGASC